MLTEETFQKILQRSPIHSSSLNAKIVWQPPRSSTLYNSSPTAACSDLATLTPLNTPGKLPPIGLCTHCSSCQGCPFPRTLQAPTLQSGLSSNICLPEQAFRTPNINWWDLNPSPFSPLIYFYCALFCFTKAYIFSCLRTLLLFL